MNGKPFEGMAIYGFDLNTGKYQSAWIDSFHMSTGIMISEGERDDAISLIGHKKGGGETSEKWGWRTVIEVTDNDSIVITA